MIGAWIGRPGRVPAPWAWQQVELPCRKRVTARSTGGRHPEQAAVANTPAGARAPQERPDVEGMDSRYARCGGTQRDRR